MIKRITIHFTGQREKGSNSFLTTYRDKPFQRSVVGGQGSAMKKVYASQDKLMVGHIRNLLENEGLVCITKNEHLATASGEIPLNECWPEIWIIDNSYYEKAKKIVSDALFSNPPKGPKWKCPKCGEKHESQFTECWNCGRIRTV